MIDIRVMIAGTLFLGKVREPVRDAGDPYGAIEMGIPFTQKPKALMIDYKTRVNPEHKLIKAKITVNGGAVPTVCKVGVECPC